MPVFRSGSSFSAVPDREFIQILSIFVALSDQKTPGCKFGFMASCQRPHTDWAEQSDDHNSESREGTPKSLSVIIHQSVYNHESEQYIDSFPLSGRDRPAGTPRVTERRQAKKSFDFVTLHPWLLAHFEN
jgi:hypothetical protein